MSEADVPAGGRASVRIAVRLLAGGLAAGLVWVALREIRSPGDYLGFVAFGRAALDGHLPYSRALEALYRPDLHAAWATWPPAFAPAAAALSLVDRVSRFLGIFLVQTAALGGLATALVFFARRMGVGADAAARRAMSSLILTAPVLLAVAVPYRILLDSLQNTQVNLLVLGLIAGAFGLLGSGRRWAGGLTLGAATSFKAAPLLLLGYLAWRGRWRDLGAAAVGVAIWWIALPALVLWLGAASAGGAAVGGGAAGGVQGAGTGVLGSYAAWLGHATSGTLLVRGSNQSLLAVILRLAPVGRRAGIALFAGVTVLLATLTLAAFGRPLRRVGPGREAAELAVMLVAISLLSPLAWKAHYVSLAPLVLVLAVVATGAAFPAGRAAGIRVGSGLLVLFALAFVALDLTGRDLVGRSLSAGAERWGVVTWTALALFVATLWRLRDARWPGDPAVIGQGRLPRTPSASGRAPT